MKVIKENFNTIDSLVDVLSHRPKNAVMKNSDSSNSTDSSFSNIKSYSEAERLLRTGYTELLPEVRKNLRKNEKVIFQYAHKGSKIQNMPIGYIPNVPNAINNRPDSMINIIKHPQKRKTLSVIYVMSGACSIKSSVFVEAGTALVSALNLIEIYGIQTELKVAFMASESSRMFSFFGNGSDNQEKELLFPTLKIKGYGERFNLTKICFPLAHPAMFRRIGFKYLETCPQVTNSNYSSGYGTVPSLSTLKENIEIPKDTYILDTDFITKNNYSIPEILKALEVIV